MVSITEISTKNFHEFLTQHKDVADKMNFAITIASEKFGDAPFDFDSKIAYNAKIPDFVITPTETGFKLGNGAMCDIENIRTFLFELGDDNGLIGVHLHGPFEYETVNIKNLDYIVPWDALNELINGEVDNVYVQESGTERSE